MNFDLQAGKLLVFVKLNPDKIELKKGFCRDVRNIGHFGTGDVEITLASPAGLENAKPSQLEEIEISPSGFGIHFPKLDADLYLPGLLEGFLGSKRWMASRLGQIGGKSRSAAKRAASKANGRLGGRPKKKAVRR